MTANAAAPTTSTAMAIQKRTSRGRSICSACATATFASSLPLTTLSMGSAFYLFVGFDH